MRVVVTGASGKTGRAVIAALQRCGHEPVALVRRPEAAQDARRQGVTARVATFADTAALVGAFTGADAVYHVPPNMHPEEELIGAAVADAAQAAGAHRFVLHSVLHPYVPQMPHHERKARTELLIRRRPLAWSIVQPASYTQNVLPFVAAAREDGRYVVPYSTTAAFTPVDLEDVADAAVVLLEKDATIHGTFELCGPEHVDSRGIAEALGQVVGRPVLAEHQPVEQWRASVAGSRPEQEIHDLAAMFDWYNQFGLTGSDVVLRNLLGRRPTDITSALTRDVSRSVRARSRQLNRPASPAAPR
ncbi:MAG TPA: NmrA family NAD(P)-binding protein [Beutenbergiaceae bacterium]|nr:NmrA family NAD(P)-binding protein [Beutenbergiaceae bacterium]